MNTLGQKGRNARKPYFDLDLSGAEPPGVPGRLIQVFGVLPWSVLHTTTSWWQERKRAWIEDLGLQPDLPPHRRRADAADALGGFEYEMIPPDDRQGSRKHWVGPPPVPPRAVRAVLASEELTSGEKLVWLVHRQLADYGSKGGERCVATAAQIGRFLGMESRNVEKARRVLKAAGLLGSRPRRAKRGESWWATLPGWGGLWIPPVHKTAEVGSGVDAYVPAARAGAMSARTTVRPSR